MLRHVFGADSFFTRWFVPIGLAQGFIALAFFQKTWPSDAKFSVIYGNTEFLYVNYDFSCFFDYLPYDSSWLFAAGLTFFLTANHSNWRRAASMAVLVGILVFAFCFMSNMWVPTNEPPYIIDPRFPCLLFVIFGGLPFLQTFISSGHWHFNYQALSQYAWNNILIAVFSCLLTAISFFILEYFSKLLNTLNIFDFYKLMKEPWFALPAYCTVKAISISIVRSNEGILVALRNICFVVCSFLAPALAVFAIAYLALLPAPRLGYIVSNPETVGIILGFSLALILCFNVILHEDSCGRYSKGLRLTMLRAAFLALPVLGFMATSGTWDWHERFGPTPARYYTLMLGAIVSVYGICYALAATQSNRMPVLIQRSNAVLALGVLGIISAAQLPYVNAAATSARARYTLIATNQLETQNYDLWGLKNTLGYPGREAFAKLKAITNHPHQIKLEEAIKRAEMQKNRIDTPVIIPDETLMKLSDYLLFRPENLILPDALPQALINNDRMALQGCHNDRPSSQKCILIAVDLTRDGLPEYVLLTGWPESSLMSGWQGRVYQYDKAKYIWEMASYSTSAIASSSSNLPQPPNLLDNQTKKFAVKPAPFDSLLVDDRLKFNFTPKDGK